MSKDHCARSQTRQEQSQRPRDERPDVGSLRALADQEFADARSRLVDCWCRPLKGDHPLLLLAYVLAQSLTKAGFTLHHCDPSHPLYCLGGVCLLPVTADQDPGGRAAVVVSWPTHDLLSHDWDRWAEYHDAIVSPFGSSGAPLVTGCRSAGPVAR